MSCSPFDLKDYLLQELAESQQRQVESHIHTCGSCRQELDRLRLTQTALAALSEEEIPQRIGFVSDKIFEPSPFRRWLSGFWNSGARLAFAGAAMLSVALIASPMLKPRPVVQNVAQVQTISEAEVRQRIDAAVTRIASDIEARYEQRTDQLVKQIQLRDQEERNGLRAEA